MYFSLIIMFTSLENILIQRVFDLIGHIFFAMTCV